MALLKVTYLLLSLGAFSYGWAPLRYDGVFSTAEFREFQQWAVTHGRTYSGEGEMLTRFNIFKSNMAVARKLNMRRMTSQDATFGASPFADLTGQEFKDTVLMTSWTRGAHTRVAVNTTAPPEEFDWTSHKDIVTSVKNQGQDGTCWAFAGTANVEALWSRKSGALSPDLSPQALSDCDGLADPERGALACGPLGATMNGFYYFVMQEGGLMTWDDYPYCSGIGECKPCAPLGYSVEWCGAPWPYSPCKDSDSCAAKYDPGKFVEGLKVMDFTYFSQDEQTLQAALVETGPLVAGVDATDLQLYTGGVLAPQSCSPDALNHAVLLVGYDVTKSFWRAKNSWGTKWGEDGFLRIQYGTGACGINADVSSAVLG